MKQDENKEPEIDLTEKNDVNDGINKIDAIDNAEAPSRTKLSTLVSRVEKKRSKKGESFTDEDGMVHERKVGFFALTFSYFVRWWKYGIIVVIFTLISAFATAVGPWFMNNMIRAVILSNGGATEPPFWAISWQAYMWIQIALFILIAICTLIANMFAGFIGKEIEISLRNEAVERLITQDISYYSNKKIGEILTKVTSDTQIIGDQSQSIPVSFISAVFTAIFALIFMFFIDWKISLVGIGLILVIVAIIGLCFGTLRSLMLKVRDVITTVNGTVINRINTIQLIKTTGTEEYEKELFENLHKDYSKAYSKMIMIQSLVITFLLVGVNSIQIILSVAAALIYQNNPNYLITMLPSMILAIGVMVGPLMQLVRVVAGVVVASSSSQRIWTIIHSKSRMNTHLNPKEGVHVDNLNGNIIFKNITFAYPEKPSAVIIPDFNFVFEKGKSYAFVGETGSGKSTVSKLLLRFYDPTFGDVLINNDVNLKDVNLPSYLSHVGYVEQEPSLFLGDVYENVKYGTKHATNEEVVEACKKADLHDLIMSWPDGYDTILGERGFMLSGGQKQRLIIARMFLKDPELLILDEATSALDNIVEKEIQKELNKLMEGRTTISIAHRLSTIKNADQIVVLGPGKGIVQTGTFEELKNEPGHFKNLYEAGLMK